MSLAPTTPAHAAADELFDRHGPVFGTDLPVYRGHVHRVIGLVELQTEVATELAGPLGLAAFFHDSGIWFDHTWDYLPPSVRRATEALGADGRQHADLVTALITEHHRLRPARHDNPLVEAFRRADLTDVSAGLIGSPGVSRQDFTALVAQYPDRGLRPMLLRAFGRGLKESPLRPAPMIKF